MAHVITMKGIDQAISNLNYRNKNSLKYRLVNTIGQFYQDESSIESIDSIGAEQLITLLWGTVDDPAIIKKKKKNLSSLKSSVNTNLKQLYKEKKNPEGIIIGSANVFVMSSEAKDDALKAFEISAKSEETVSLGQIKDILNLVSEILSDPEAISDRESTEGLRKLDQIKHQIQDLSEKVGLGASETFDHASQSSIALSGQKGTTGDSHLAEVPELIEEPEEIEVDDAIEEVEVTDDLDEVEVEEDLDEVEVTDGLEETEVSGASGDKGFTGGFHGTETKEGGEGVREIIGDGSGAVEKAGRIERGGPREGMGLEETAEAHAQGELSEIPELIEEPEDIEVDDAIEEVEVDIKGDSEEVGMFVGAEETDILAGDSGEKFSNGGYQYDNEIRKARLLAEEFNTLLGAIDKYYNQYILIPKGEYIVGSKRPKTNEKPEHLVHLSSFYIGKFPVTNALFEIFIEKTGYKTTAEKLGYGTVYYGRSQKTIDERTGLERFTWNTALISKTVEGACWYQPLGRGSTVHNKRNHPVVQVSIEDAIAFAAWTGKNLPTEDEWEAASRTAKGYVFPWGNEWNINSCNVEESYIGDTTPVDKYLEFGNDYGIVDVIGNVLEWTREKSEPPSFVKDTSKFYVVKGGSWISDNTIRLFHGFTLKSESHSNILGFRCVAY